MPYLRKTIPHSIPSSCCCPHDTAPSSPFLLVKPKAFRFEDPMFDKDYGMFKAYANSKLALLMFAEELQHRLDREKSKVIVNSANPGASSMKIGNKKKKKKKSRLLETLKQQLGTFFFGGGWVDGRQCWKMYYTSSLFVCFHV